MSSMMLMPPTKATRPCAAARSGFAKRARDAPPGGVAGVDVGLEEDLALRLADRGLERGEILHARAQQRQVVSGQELDRHAGELTRAAGGPKARRGPRAATTRDRDESRC